MMKKDNYDYVINVGNDVLALEPLIAVKTLNDAITETKKLEGSYRYIDVVYSPEDDIEMNKLMYKNYCGAHMDEKGEDK